MLFFLAFLIVWLVLWGVVAAVLPFLWALLQTAIGWLARFITRFERLHHIYTMTRERMARFRAYFPVAVIVIVGAVVTAIAGDSFLDLGELVHERSPMLQQIDTHWHDWAVAHREADATLFFVTISAVGGPIGAAIVCAIASIALAVQRRWRWLAYLAITCVGGAMLNLELKRHFARARPDIAEMLRLARGYSFPSGHAMGSTVVYGALSYLAFRIITRWRWKALALSFAMTIVLATALSRVYLGVHWISDVGAGIAAGTIWDGATTSAYELFRRIRLLRAIGAQSAGATGSQPVET